MTFAMQATLICPSPPPFTGEGQGGGQPQIPNSTAAPSPTLPRKRGRERTACIAQ